jgi:branched-chain amino acid aminotransferase
MTTDAAQAPSPQLSYEVTLRDDVTPPERIAQILESPGFGKVFTDHMVVATWNADGGWGGAQVRPYGPFQLDPAAAVLHYAQEIFEGMKAYRHADGSIWTFRPEANAARFARSARRLALPVLPEADFVESLRQLVTVDQVWVPAGDAGEKSLYLRPFMFASEAFLGVRPAQQVTYSVIASPAGAYFPGGLKPVTLWISTDYARAGEGGTGAAKCGGNYASSLAGQLEGIEHGCDQAVFLDSSTHTYIEELGGMNLFIVTKDGKIVTPELTGTILEGVTRRSILELAKELDLEPEERRIPIDEWKDGAASGDIVEVFACGTAAVITPVGELRWAGGSVDHRRDGHEDHYAEAIRNKLLDIQYGRAEDAHGWLTRLV